MEQVRSTPNESITKANLVTFILVGLAFAAATTFLVYLHLETEHSVALYGVIPLSIISIALCYWASKSQCQHQSKDHHERVANLQKEIASLNAALVASRDELSQSQATLVHSEKLASLGQLSAGIAHEINNPVGFMMSNMCSLKEYIFFLEQLAKQQLELLGSLTKQEKLNHEEQIAEIETTLKIEDLDYVLSDANALIDESINGGSRIKDITNGMKGYVRDNDEPQLVDVNDLIEQTINITWNQIKYNCTLKKELQECSKVKITPSAFNQVLLNLLMNASHAMEGIQGTLSVRSYQESDTVIVEVQDTGCGIEQEHLDKIFEPFFTTKPVGQGTGLGMSISYDIVKGFGGDITVESTVGKGTLFRICLPSGSTS